MPKTKYFALVDCNNFYVSCERVFNPGLENKPVAVLSNNDGCLVSRSDELKDLNVAMAAPYFQLKEVLDKAGAKIFSSNYALYGDMSQRVMACLAEFCENLEIYSIDEAFLDLSYLSEKDLYSFGLEIQAKVKKYTGIPVSIGIAPTKTLAKAANEFAKKEARKSKKTGLKSKYQGVFVLQNNDEFSRCHLLSQLPVDDVWGVGRQYAKILKSQKKFTALDLANTGSAWVKKNMTIQGSKTVSELNWQGCIDLEMLPTKNKSIICSRSFRRPVTSLSELEESVSTFTFRAGEKLRRQGLACSYISVFIAASRFDQNNKYFNSVGTALDIQSNLPSDLINTSLRLLKQAYKTGFRYKKAGVMLSGLVGENTIQTNLFEPEKPNQKEKSLVSVIDKLNRKYGTGTIKTLVQGVDNSWTGKNELRSPRYTTVWEEILKVD